MSPQSRRAEPPGRAGPSRHSPASGAGKRAGGASNPLFAEMLRASRELLAVRSPLDAELMVSELLGTWWDHRSGTRASRGQGGRRADIDELLGEGLVAYAARQGTPAALALLSGIACLGTQRQASLAERAALELMDQGVARPAWAEHVGAVEAADCYVNSDGYGDRDEVICVFSYAGQEQHALVVAVDYNAGGMVRDGWVTSQVGKLLDYCRHGAGHGDGGTVPGPGTPRPAGRPSAAPPADSAAAATALLARASFVQVAPPNARRLLEAALAGTENAPNAPVSKSFPSYHAFIRARIRVLPPSQRDAPGGAAAAGGAVAPGPLVPAGVVGPGAARRPAWRRDRRAMLAAEFLASDEAEDLSDLEAASRCADHIVDYGCDQDFGRPLRVSPAKAEAFLLDWLPRKVMLTSAEQDAMPHVLLAWTRWAGARSGLDIAAISRTLDAVFDAMSTFGAIYRDPASFGLEPSLVARLLPDRDLEALPRRAFAFGLLQGTYRGTDLSTLDPARPEHRRTLLAADHCDPAGHAPSPEHLDQHLALADRLWRGDPPELWEAAQRMLDLGQSRHEVEHALLEAIGRAGRGRRGLAAALTELPPERPG